MQLTKLKWRCRRGTQELDQLLINYLDKQYLNASVPEQQHFQQLLDLEDSELLQLFFSPSSHDPKGLNYLIKKIRHSTGFQHQ